MSSRNMLIINKLYMNCRLTTFPSCNQLIINLLLNILTFSHLFPHLPNEKAKIGRLKPACCKAVVLVYATPFPAAR